MRNSVLNYRRTPAVKPDATITLSRADLRAVLTGQTTLDALTAGKKATVDGNGAKLDEILSLAGNFEFWFNIVTSNQAAK